MKRSLAYRAITHVADAKVLGLVVFFSECHASTQWNLTPDNAMTSCKIHSLIKDVHGSAFTFRDTRFLSIEFSHHRFWVGA